MIWTESILQAVSLAKEHFALLHILWGDKNVRARDKALWRKQGESQELASALSLCWPPKGCHGSPEHSLTATESEDLWAPLTLSNRKGAVERRGRKENVSQGNGRNFKALGPEKKERMGSGPNWAHFSVVWNFLYWAKWAPTGSDSQASTLRSTGLSWSRRRNTTHWVKAETSRC